MEENEIINNRIIDTKIEDVLHNSMIPYAEYVIMDRAIPRVEDGLKPVQRRILYSMYEIGITPEKPTRKSARIVGDCLGKFHPHGDSSVYGALVRMGQDFSIRNVLIDGQGNFGSIDGDPAAAMRYTEARLMPLAMELLRDIDKNTVEFTNNFDDTLVEPVTLPGRFPNLLVNGASGIAVGLATNIPTHNLTETINGTIAMIKNPSITLSQLMEHIKAPDFPSGGYLIKQDLIKAYETGRGKITLRAKMHIEKDERDREVICITELPYQVNKAVIQQKIIAVREAQKEDKSSILLGITNVVDESDMSGMRICISVKKDYDAREIIAELIHKTDLQINFNINMVAIAGGKPRTLSLIEILREYIIYQMKVILRRSQYDYDEAKKREHILDGLVVAVNNIDEVIRIIRASKNTPEAKRGLMDRFILSSEQAQAILDMRLAKINTLEVYKLEQELKELKERIEELYQIIHSEEKQRQVLIAELTEIKKKYGDERRSEIIDSFDDVVVSHADDVIIEDSVIELQADGKVKRYLAENYAKIKAKSKMTADNIVIEKFETQSITVLKAFTNLGNCYQFKADIIENSKPNQKTETGEAVQSLLLNGEKIIKIMDMTDREGELLFMTKSGMIKKSNFTEYGLQKEFYVAVKLKENDEVIAIEERKEGKNIFFAMKNGMCLVCLQDDVPSQGRVSIGVKGVNLADDDEIVSATQVGESGEIYVVTTLGNAKRVIVANIPVTARYRKGVKLVELKRGEYTLSAGLVKMPIDLAIIGDTNDMEVVNTQLLPLEKRDTKGKPLANLKFFEKLVKIVPIK